MPKKIISEEKSTTLSVEEIDAYIITYYTSLIEDPKKREELITKARRRTQDYTDNCGFQTSTQLHESLSNILDLETEGKNDIIKVFSYTSKGQTRRVSIGFHKSRSLDDILPSRSSNLYAKDTHHKIVGGDLNDFEELPDLNRGIKILNLIQSRMSEEEFMKLLQLWGSYDHLLYALSRSYPMTETYRISAIENVNRIVADINSLPLGSQSLYVDFLLYHYNPKIKNPIKIIDDISKPIMHLLIAKLFQEKGVFVRKELEALGFKTLFKRTHGGIVDIVKETNPDLMYSICSTKRWKREEESVADALDIISSYLYTIPGYKEAELNNDRDMQVNIINKYIGTKTFEARYMYKKGLKNLMSYFFDSTGKFGLKKECSPKALLEFYSDKKGLNWFDRDKKTYVQRWRISEMGKWKQGEKSVDLAIEAISDALYQLPGYREAEILGNRIEQIRIIDRIREKSSLSAYFIGMGLESLMNRLIDPEGEHGIKKYRSPIVLLEFYSDKKQLKWFDKSENVYLTYNTTTNGRLQLIVAYKQAA